MRFMALLICFLPLLYAHDYDPSKEKIKAVEETPPQTNKLANTQPREEFRSYWADAWNKGVFNEQQVQEVVQSAKKYGYNAIMLQVRRRGDAIYFPKFPNTEPRMSGLDKSFDALQTMIQYAHAEGIEVHAWITTFLISTAHPPKSKDHVFHRHPEFLSQNRAGEKKIGEGYYLDPGHPGTLDWNSQVVMDLVKNYTIDGLHFDYVRFPQQDSGFNPTSVKRYNEKYGLSGKPQASDPQFASWRRQQITDWLRVMYLKILDTKPQMKVTAATFASRTDAYNHRFQDWAQWMKEGIIDANFPMNYSTKDSIYHNRVNDTLAHSFGRHVYMGVGAYLLPSTQLIKQLKYARDKGSHGLVLFSYAHSSKSSTWHQGLKEIHQQLFYYPAEVPKMAWKNSLDSYHFLGRVMDNDGQGKEGMTIRYSNKEVTTDSRGYFALMNLVSGQLMIQIGTKQHDLSVRGDKKVIAKEFVQ